MRSVLFILVAICQIHVVFAQGKCKASSVLMDEDGAISDGTKRDESYEGSNGCHWKIQVPDPNSVITLDFKYLSLKSNPGFGNDVVLINLGPGSDPGPGWEPYQRKQQPMGEDRIGWYDYTMDASYMGVDCQSEFNPTFCDVLDGTLLADASWDDFWFMRVDPMFPGEDITVTSTTNVLYAIFRSFVDPWAPKHEGPATQVQNYGFRAHYIPGSAYCSGAVDTVPHMSLAKRVYETSPFTIRDNVQGSYAPDSSCSWLVAPTFDENNVQTHFDSIWLSFTTVELNDESDIIVVYDGDTDAASELVRIAGPLEIPPDDVKSTTGKVFITFTSDSVGHAGGFTTKWKAAYCPFDCSGKGTCTNGHCFCDEGWEGDACNVPAGWHCLGSHYNTGDGCDCGCGLYDPDCGDISTHVLECEAPEMLSSSGELFNSTEGKFFTGVCLYCPLPDTIPALRAQPDTEWDTANGILPKTCPLTSQCAAEEQCDVHGSCVAVASQEDVLDTLRKACVTNSDCPDYTVCLSNNVCGSDNLAAVFPEPTALVKQCKFNGFPTDAITVELWIKVSSTPNFQHPIFEYPGFVIAIEGGVSLSIEIDGIVKNPMVDLSGGMWKALGVTWESSTGAIKVYVNGLLVFDETGHATGSVLSDQAELKVGQLEGAISKLRVWNVVRDSTRILSETLLSNEIDNLVGHYRFLDGSLRDLSVYSNDMEADGASIQSTVETTNSCLSPPIIPTTGFPVGAVLQFTAQFQPNDVFSIEFLTDAWINSLRVEINHINMKVLRVSEGVLDDDTGGFFGLEANKDFELLITRQNGYFDICIDGGSCIQHADGATGDSIAQIYLNRIGATLSNVCFLTGESELEFLSIVNDGSVLTLDGDACVLPMDVLVTDCDSFDAIVTAQAFDNADLLSKAKSQVETDFSVSPCACDPLDPWEQTFEFIYLSPDKIEIQIRYEYYEQITQSLDDPFMAPMGTEDCGSSPNPGDRCYSRRRWTTRYFEYELIDANWEVVFFSNEGEEASYRCDVSPEYAGSLTTTTLMTSYSCSTAGETSRSNPVPRPWCYTAAEPTVRKLCSSEENACNIPRGEATYSSLTGRLTDGYTDSYSSRSMICTFELAPSVPSNLVAFSRIEIAFQQVALESGDEINIQGVELGGAITGVQTPEQLPRVTGPVNHAILSFASNLNGGGTPSNGFDAEYRVWYDFSTGGSSSLCSEDVTLTVNAGETRVFPENLISGNVETDGCIYTITAMSDAVDSIWLRFHAFNLTSETAGDRLEIYDFDPDSSTETLLISITNETFALTNWGVGFDGASHYVVSSDPLAALPVSILFWVNVPDTVAKDCTVATNCIGNVSKKMKVMGSSSTHPFNVELDPDTGFLSVNFAGRVYVMSQDVRTGEWLHVAFVLDQINAQVYGYINGVRKAITATGPIKSLTAPSGVFFLGGSHKLPDDSYIYFNGHLRQIQLFSTMKTVFDIEQVIAGTSPCMQNDGALILCYEFDSPSFTATDKSTNENNAVFFGGSYLDPIQTTNVTAITFASEHKSLRLKFFPSSDNSTAHFRFFYEGAVCPGTCQYGGECIRGKCRCASGYTGTTCADKVYECGATILVPGGSGSINVPEGARALPSRNWFPVTDSFLGYPPVNCTWIIKQSRATIKLTIEDPSLSEGDQIRIIDGEETYQVHHDGLLQYDLSAIEAISLAQFYSRGAFSYDSAVINAMATETSTVTMRVAKEYTNCRKDYHKYAFRRGQTCKDATDFGLTKTRAGELAELWWWEESEMAYASSISPQRLYFNEFDATDVKVTMTYMETDLEGTETTPYPQQFHFIKDMADRLQCKATDDVGLSKSDIAAVVNSGWPTATYDRRGRLRHYVRMPLTQPVFSYVGDWQQNPGQPGFGLLKFDFDTLRTQAFNSPDGFTILVQVTTRFNNFDEQVLLSQEGDNMEAIVLKLGPQTLERSPWIFGQRYKNEPLGSENPTVGGDTDVVLAIQYENGIIRYFVNGKRFASIDTNVCVYDPYFGCREPVGNFNENSQLVIGGVAGDGWAHSVWQGSIRSVQIYGRAMMASELAASIVSPDLVRPITLRKKIVNQLDSTSARINAIGLLTIDLPTGVVESKVNAEFEFTRAPCTVSPYLPKSQVRTLIQASWAETYAEEDIIFNAYDETSATVSLYDGESYHHAVLTRYYEYDHGLNDNLILDIIRQAGTERFQATINIENIWVFDLTPNSAAATLKRITESGQETYFMITLINDSEWMPESFVDLVMPTESTHPAPQCNGMMNLFEPKGAVTDGSGEFDPIQVLGDPCDWEISIPPDQSIFITFTRFNVLCDDGDVKIELDNGIDPPEFTSFCDMDPVADGEVEYEGVRLRIQFSAVDNMAGSTGFFLQYRFSSFSIIPNTNVVPSASYIPWIVDENVPDSAGTAQCVLGTPDPAEPWRWSAGKFVATIDQACHDTEVVTATNEWICAGLSGIGSSTCAELEADADAPWDIVSMTSSQVPDLEWYNTSTVVKTASKSITNTNTAGILTHSTDEGSIQIDLDSVHGNRGKIKIQYSTARIFYAAPQSYTPPSGFKGDGTRKQPFTYNLNEILANHTSPGDTIRLYPGRYEGTGYCDLTISKHIVIESLSGPEWTLLDCLGTSRGWIIDDKDGVSRVAGLSFLGCITTGAPLHGAALLISSQATVENCRFFENEHSATGTLGIVAPGNVEVSSCTFEENQALSGSGIAVLSATAKISDCHFADNTASVTGTVHVGQLVVGSAPLQTLSRVEIKDSSMLRNSAAAGGSGVSAFRGSRLILSSIAINDTILGAGILLEDARVVIQDSMFSNNAKGALRASEGSEIEIYSSHFVKNQIVDANVAGAAVFVDDSHLDLHDSHLSENYVAWKGGAVAAFNSSANLTSCVFQANEAGDLGGAICIEGLSATYAKHFGVGHIVDCEFERNSGANGGAISLQDSPILLMSNSFSQNEATDRGGALYLSEFQDSSVFVNASANTFESNAADLGGAVALENAEAIRFNRDELKWNSASSGGSLWTSKASASFFYCSFNHSSALVNGGAIHVSSSSAITMNMTTIQHCDSKDSGGGVSISGSEVSLVNSQIFNTTSEVGGGISVLAKSVLLSDGLSVKNVSAVKGGGVYGVDTKYTSASLIRSTFQYASASDSGGAFYFVLAFLQLHQVQVLDSTAQFGAVMALQGSNIDISSATLQNCQAFGNGGAFYAITSALTVYNDSSIQGNKAVSGAGIYAFASNVTLNDTAVQGNVASSTGGAITLITADLKTHNASCRRNQANKGGCIQADLSQIALLQTTVELNEAFYFGGAFFLQGDSVMATDASFISSNTAPLGGAAYFFQILKFSFLDTEFRNNSAVPRPGNRLEDTDGAFRGGAVTLNTVGEDSEIIKCLFVQNQAQANGGAMYINIGRGPNLLIHQTRFERNQGDFGGAIISENSHLVLEDVEFVDQVATSGGGAIYWTGIEPSGYENSTSYINNRAAYGPNIASIPYEIVPEYNASEEASGEPFYIPLQVEIVDQYGQIVVTDDVTQVQAALADPSGGAFIVGESKATAEAGVATFETLGMRYTPGLNTSFVVTSGHLLTPESPLLVTMRECIQGEVKPDGLHRCVRCPFGEFSWNVSDKACHKCPTGAVCFGGSHVANLRGHWRFENTTGVCARGSPYDGCAFTKCNHADACIGFNESIESYRVERDADDNVILLSTTDLSSQYKPNQTIYVQGVEKQIIDVSYNVEAGFKLVLEPDAAIAAENGVKLYLEEPETCGERFTGNLCNRCAKGYSRQGKTDCAKCPDSLLLTYAVVVGGFFAAAFIAVMLIKMTIAKSRKKKDRMSIMSKIFTSYLQLVSLASSFKLNWPQEVRRMFDAQETVASPGDHLISIECVLDKHSTGTLDFPIYYQKLAFFLVLPIIATVIPCVFWMWRYVVHRARHIRSWSWKRFKIPDQHNGNVEPDQLEQIIEAAGDTPTDILIHETTRLSGLDKGPQPLMVVKKAFIKAKKGEMWDKAILSVIVLIFLLHPNLTKQILLIFTCVPLKMKDDATGQMEMYLSSDMDIDCSNPMHGKVKMLIGLPAMLLYTFGIPGFGFLILYFRRKHLSDPRVKLQFGFLYDGYEHEYYYWELWVMIRKVMVIFVSVFLSQIGVASQSLGATAITFFALYMHLRAMPYEDEELDKLEQFSLLTSVFTLYCGLFFFHDEIGYGGRLALIGMIFLANGAFLWMFLKLMLIELKRKASDAVSKAKSKLKKNKDSPTITTRQVIPLKVEATDEVQVIGHADDDDKKL